MLAKLAVGLVAAVGMMSGLVLNGTNSARAAEDCTFTRGVTTCLSTTQSTVTVQRTVFSGCLAGPTGVPGRRITVFEDTVLVTETTTTRAHGREGPVFESTTTEVRQILSSREVSSVCEPL